MSRSDTAPVSQSGMLASQYKHPVAMLVLVGLSLNFLWASGHDGQRCVEIVLLCIGTLIMLGRIVSGRATIRLRPAACTLLAFFLIGIVSAAVAWSPRHAIYEWSSFLLLVMLAFGIAAELRKAGHQGLSRFLQFIGIICGLHALRVLVAYAAALASGYQLNMHGIAVGFSNVRFLNHTQTALLPLIVLLCLQAPRATALRRAWFALAAFWWALLFVSEARATILALGVGCLAAFVVRRGHARDFLRMMLLSALAGVVLYALVFILLPVLAGLSPIGLPSKVVARTAADPASGRTLLWKLALELSAAHPWLGVGPHHFAHESIKIYNGAHPHDWLLQIAAEWGVPALLCLLGAIVLGVRGLVRSGKRIADGDLRNQQMLVVLLATCAAIFVDGLFSGVLVMPQSQLAIALVIGCAAGWVRSLHAGAPAPSPSPAARYLAAGLAVAGLCGLVWSVAPGFMDHARGEALTPAERAVNEKGNWPRLWEAGYF